VYFLKNHSDTGTLTVLFAQKGIQMSLVNSKFKFIFKKLLTVRIECVRVEDILC
jgi:hypothetical protein